MIVDRACDAARSTRLRLRQNRAAPPRTSSRARRIQIATRPTDRTSDLTLELADLAFVLPTSVLTLHIPLLGLPDVTVTSRHAPACRLRV